MKIEAHKKRYMAILANACEVSLDCIEKIKKYNEKRGISFGNMNRIREECQRSINDYLQGNPDCKTKIEAIAEMYSDSNPIEIMIAVSSLSKKDLLEHKKRYN